MRLPRCLVKCPRENEPATRAQFPATQAQFSATRAQFQKVCKAKAPPRSLCICMCLILPFLAHLFATKARANICVSMGPAGLTHFGTQELASTRGSIEPFLKGYGETELHTASAVCARLAVRDKGLWRLRKNPYDKCSLSGVTFKGENSGTQEPASTRGSIVVSTKGTKTPLIWPGARGELSSNLPSVRVWGMRNGRTREENHPLVSFLRESPGSFQVMLY